MNNPLQMLKMIKNPKQFAMNIIKKNNNPVFNNLIDMANKNDTEGLQKFARNVFKEKGQDFDSEFREFMSAFKK